MLEPQWARGVTIDQLSDGKQDYSRGHLSRMALLLANLFSKSFEKLKVYEKFSIVCDVFATKHNFRKVQLKEIFLQTNGIRKGTDWNDIAITWTIIPPPGDLAAGL